MTQGPLNSNKNTYAQFKNEKEFMEFFSSVNKSFRSVTVDIVICWHYE